MSSWPSFSAFIRDCTIQDKVLVTPVRYLWREYLHYCMRWGFQPVEPHIFIFYLKSVEGVEIKEGGSGRIRRAALGITLKTTKCNMTGTDAKG